MHCVDGAREYMRWALRLLSTGALNDSSDDSTVRSVLEHNTLLPAYKEYALKVMGEKR